MVDETIQTIAQPYDPGLKAVVKVVRKALKEQDDDFLLVIAGSTGTGKSRLAMHVYGLWAAETGEEQSITQIGLTRQDFAIAQNNVSKDRKFCCYDEANVNKRDFSSSWNKDIMDLFWANRGDNAFHVWCNPSVEWLDKAFIEERIKGVIFIFTKGKQRRKYWYFTQSGLLKMYEKESNLKRRVIKKYGKRFAFYEGWFDDYKGDLLDAYKAKKSERIQEKKQTFFEKYGQGEAVSLKEFARRQGISYKTAKKYMMMGLEDGSIESDCKLATGQFTLRQKHQDQLLFKIESKGLGRDGVTFTTDSAPKPYFSREGKKPAKTTEEDEESFDSDDLEDD